MRFSFLFPALNIIVWGPILKSLEHSLIFNKNPINFLVPSAFIKRKVVHITCFIHFLVPLCEKSIRIILMSAILLIYIIAGLFGLRHDWFLVS